MTEKEQAFIERWGKTHAKGKRNYILKITIFFSLFFPLFLYVLEMVWPQTEGGYTTQDWIKNLAVGVVLGLFLSFRNWKANEKRMEIINGKNIEN